MHKIIVCPDSFKGSLSAKEAAILISDAFCAASDEAQTVMIPIADGGEGTVEALGAEKVICTVNDAFMEPITAFWGDLGEYAVIELAACAGLPQAKVLNPELTTTYGVGELILNALDAGKRKFIIALGGSSTNDLACGMACALGVRFYDGDGNSFVPKGGTLSKIASVDRSGLDIRISECEFITMCDVTNPLYGENGAAYVFAPQKGADDAMVKRLDQGLRHAAAVLEREFAVEIASLPGSGAAGGCGAGARLFLSSELKSGIDVVLDVKAFDEELEGAEYVITGEGKFDFQSLGGKAISGIAKRCIKSNTPLIVLAGCADENELCYERGITAVFSIQRKALPLEEAKAINDVSLYKTAFNVAKLIFCKQKQN